MKPSIKIDFAVGGQAVIEGVMMRSPHYYTVSVRNPDGGIQMMQKKFSSITLKSRVLRFPIIRGMVHLVESMTIGMRSLNYSNSVFTGEDLKQNPGDDSDSTNPTISTNSVISTIRKILWSVLGFIYIAGTFGITLFMIKFLPLWVAGFAAEIFPIIKEKYVLFNLVDGLTKIIVFVGYLSIISVLNDIKRVFQYHGAEHKSIWAYEKGLELTVDNARAQTRFHPRCGTSFIFIVILIGIFVYTFLPPSENFWIMLGERIAALPLIAGISYETLKLSAKFQNNFLVKLFVLPGLLIQRLTTREPDDRQLEIALHSLKESLKVENLGIA